MENESPIKAMLFDGYFLFKRNSVNLYLRNIPTK